MDAPWVRSPPDSNVEFIGADYSTLASDLDWTLDEDEIGRASCRERVS